MFRFRFCSSERYVFNSVINNKNKKNSHNYVVKWFYVRDLSSLLIPEIIKKLLKKVSYSVEKI